MKKAQGLSMTTIVVAALALLVLVVLVLSFTGRMNIFSTGVQESSKCLTFCNSIGYENAYSTSESNCKIPSVPETKYVPTIDGPDGTENQCCCKRAE